MKNVATFEAWPKIPRGTRGEFITITEKLDGTNACIIIQENPLDVGKFEITGVQSRKRMITPAEDNYGFANWVAANEADLTAKLDVGRHFGEWYGLGIQGNPHCKPSKRFALFNTNRWQDGRQERPAGVECVPILYEGEWSSTIVEEAMDALWLEAGHQGYSPEGIVVWYAKSRRMEKHTFKFVEGKWKGEA